LRLEKAKKNSDGNGNSGGGGHATAGVANVETIGMECSDEESSGEASCSNHDISVASSKCSSNIDDSDEDDGSVTSNELEDTTTTTTLHKQKWELLHLS